MFLKMYISDMLIDRVFITLDDTESVREREELLQQAAARLYKKHVRKIYRCGVIKPTFFIDHVPSKMNHETEVIK